MREEKWSVEDFSSKMDHEGGPLELFRWGLRPDEIEDVRLREIWSEYCRVATTLCEIENGMFDYLDDLAVG